MKSIICSKNIDSYRTLAYQDYYPWWSKCDESDDSGKLLVVDTSDKKTLHIFFDDNIERDRAHIVDAR